MTTYGATEPKTRAKKARDLLFPVRLVAVLLVAPPLLITASLLCALMHREDAE